MPHYAGASNRNLWIRAAHDRLRSAHPQISALHRSAVSAHGCQSLESLRSPFRLDTRSNHEVPGQLVQTTLSAPTRSLDATPPASGSPRCREQASTVSELTVNLASAHTAVRGVVASSSHTSALVDLLHGTVSMLDGRHDDGLEVLVRQHVGGPHRRCSPVQLGQPFEKLEVVYGLIHG